MHEAFDGLQGVMYIVDDVVVTGYGQNVDAATKEHDANLQAFLKKCVERGVVLNSQKSELRKTRLEFMSHIIGADGIHSSPERVRAVVEMLNLPDVSSTRSFLGVVSYLAKFHHISPLWSDRFNSW